MCSKSARTGNDAAMVTTAMCSAAAEMASTSTRQQKRSGSSAALSITTAGGATAASAPRRVAAAARTPADGSMTAEERHWRRAPTGSASPLATDRTISRKAAAETDATKWQLLQRPAVVAQHGLPGFVIHRSALPVEHTKTV